MAGVLARAHSMSAMVYSGRLVRRTVSGAPLCHGEALRANRAGLQPQRRPEAGDDERPDESWGYRSTPDPAARVAARSAATSARFARFSRRSARRASLSLPACRSARRLARSAFATRRSARSIERAYRFLAPSARLVRRQATNRAVSGHTNQATAAAPARSSAPWLPASAPYHAPATTTGSVTTCRSQLPPVTLLVLSNAW